jgi:2-polyprenyl-6-hydroxyphenyl methylase / 3-demethylubiquinone-9 3-methyltransferase
VALFDTPNRTLVSKLATKATQQWRLARIVDFAAHDWATFLPPEELAGRMRRHGMTVEETVGLGPRAGIRATLASLIGVRRGRLSYRRASERLDMGQTHFAGLSYMGFAVKGGSPGG